MEEGTNNVDMAGMLGLPPGSDLKNLHSALQDSLNLINKLAGSTQLTDQVTSYDNVFVYVLFFYICIL